MISEGMVFDLPRIALILTRTYIHHRPLTY